MNSEKIVIEHEGGFATSIFILQNLIIMLVLLYLIYDFAKSKIISEHGFSIIYSLVVLLFIFMVFIIGKYLKSIYSLQKFIVDNKTLKIGNKVYNLGDLGFRYIHTGGQSTLLAASLYVKTTNKQIGLLVFSFWAGSILNITPETFEKIFENSKSPIDYIKKETKTININSINMEEERQELKQFDTAWYIVYAVILIPIIFIFYLISKG